MRRDKRIPRTLQVAAAFEGERYGHVAGDIVRFRGDGSPLRSLSLAIDPVQDLHGYDAPWPAGGGKNKLAPAYSAGTTKTANDVNYLFNSDGTVSVSGTCSDTNSWQDVVSYFSLPAGTYTLSGGVSNSIYLSLRDYNNVSLATSKSGAETFTISETTTVRVRACVLANTVVPSNTVLRPMLELGTTATPFAPYSNICPISGWTEANVWRTGKNLLALTPCWRMNYNPTVGAVDNIVSLIDTTWTDNGDGTFSLASLGSWASAGFLTPLLPAGAYTYHIEFVTGSTVRKSINVYDANYVAVSKSTSQPAGAVSETRTITLAEPGYIGIGLYGYGEAITIKEPGVYVGSTYTAYTPYSGNQYTIQLGQTVYGGTLDVLSGVLTVDRAEVDLGTLSWTYDSTRGYFRTSSITGIITGKTYTAIICDQYSTKAGVGQPNADCRIAQNSSGGLSTSVVNIKDTRYTDATVFTAALDGVKAVYELATPITIPLSDITISTLKGQNVVWGDCGEVDVEYVADNGVEGGKLALLLRNKPELLIAMRKGGSPQELLLAMGSRGDARPSITPVRPGLDIKDDEEEELRKW